MRSSSECVLLSSRTDPLVMAFHVTSSPPIQSLVSAYSLKIPLAKEDGPLRSLAAVTLTRDTQTMHGPRPVNDSTLLLGLSPDAAVWSIAMRDEVPDQDLDEERFRRNKNVKKMNVKVKWSADVAALVRGSRVIRKRRGEAQSNIAGTRYRELDYRWAWLSASFRD